MGRKKLYANDAERAAAYRARKAVKQQAEIEALRAQAAAVPAEAILATQNLGNVSVEREALWATEREALQKEISDLKHANSILELDLRDANRTKPGKLPKAAALKHRQAALNAAFVGSYFTSPDDAKRFRTNTTRAATAAGEAASLLERTEFDLRQHLAGDIELLKIAANILNSYANSFESAQKEAEHTKARRERERDEKYKREIAELAAQKFGNPIDPVSVQSMALDLLEFFKNGDVWILEKRRSHGVVRASICFGPSNTSDEKIKNAMKAGDPKKLAIVLAEILRGTGNVGSAFKYHDELCWSAGLDDFEAWRKERAAV